VGNIQQRLIVLLAFLITVHFCLMFSLLWCTSSADFKLHLMSFFWVLVRVDTLLLADVSEKHTISIFGVEVAVLGSRGIFVGLGESRGEEGADHGGELGEGGDGTEPIRSLQAGIGT
jgi:hypothetical protein